jgi:hypothetical protein
MVKINKSSHIDSPPTLSIPKIGIRVGPSRNNLTIGRRPWNMLILEHEYLMVRIMHYAV